MDSTDLPVTDAPLRSFEAQGAVTVIPGLRTYVDPSAVTDGSRSPDQVLLRRSIYEAMRAADITDEGVREFFGYREVHSYDLIGGRGTAYLDSIPEQVWVDAARAQQAATVAGDRVRIEDGSPLPQWLVQVINTRPGSCRLERDSPAATLFEIQLLGVDWFAMADDHPEELCDPGFQERASQEIVAGRLAAGSSRRGLKRFAGRAVLRPGCRPAVLRAVGLGCRPSDAEAQIHADLLRFCRQWAVRSGVQ